MLPRQEYNQYEEYQQYVQYLVTYLQNDPVFKAQVKIMSHYNHQRKQDLNYSNLEADTVFKNYVLPIEERSSFWHRLQFLVKDIIREKLTIFKKEGKLQSFKLKETEKVLYITTDFSGSKEKFLELISETIRMHFRSNVLKIKPEKEMSLFWLAGGEKLMSSLGPWDIKISKKKIKIIMSQNSMLITVILVPLENGWRIQNQQSLEEQDI